MTSDGDLRRDVRAQISEFLTTRRARVTPEMAGLPVYGGDRRRVPGLRRSEVASLAGISPEYMTKLERGTATGVSEGVLDGLTHALQLDEAERRHLEDLLRTAGTTRRPNRRQPRQRVRPTIVRLLESMPLSPAFVMAGNGDVLAANVLGRALFSPLYDDPGRPVNTARFVFLDPRAADYYREHDRVAGDTVAVLRAEAGRDPYARDLSDLIGQLSTRSEDFRRRWAAHDVQLHTSGTKLLHHPVVGDLDLWFESLPLPGDPGQSLLVYSAEPASSSADALALLASWASTADVPG
ncbi:XRE family transcriptional regulator [Marmoricola sp. Leaf446]|uniref:helix-turn-helix transcriptional regulator n=1 Tax=Marmoricola sp. Leaf446 TaxID=1736379 RepID=UPI0006F54B0A|nr:helix-turn-helix transcriptional regulator [Marmoricola sp. Leaf446]KQT89518.1 XRE family transcriptional regulator [Marmoricola sp. Leaf446]